MSTKLFGKHVTHTHTFAYNALQPKLTKIPLTNFHHNINASRKNRLATFEFNLPSTWLFGSTKCSSHRMDSVIQFCEMRNFNIFLFLHIFPFYLCWVLRFSINVCCNNNTQFNVKLDKERYKYELLSYKNQSFYTVASWQCCYAMNLKMLEARNSE